MTHTLKCVPLRACRAAKLCIDICLAILYYVAPQALYLRVVGLVDSSTILKSLFWGLRPLNTSPKEPEAEINAPASISVSSDGALHAF